MKRNILSVLLACLMIVSLCLMVGCKTDDLEAQIQENDAKQEGAVSDLAADLESDVKSAADTAAANLAEAQKKLEAMISSGDAVDAAALKAATAEFNTALAAAEEALSAAIDAAKKDASDANVALEASLEKAIDDAVTAVTAATDKKITDLNATLAEAIAAGDATLSTKINAVATELSALQDSVLEDMIAFDGILREELTAKYDAAIDALVKKYDKAIADLAAATEAALDDAVAALEALIAENADADASVDELNAAVADLEALIDAAEAAATAANDALKAELQAEIDADVKVAVDALTAAMNQKVVDLQAEIDADVKASSDELKALIEAAKTLADSANATLKTELQAEIDADVKVAVDALTVVINQKVVDLQAEIDADVAKAVSDLTALIETAKALADSANATLKTELQAEIDADVKVAVDALTVVINQKVVDLQAEIDADVKASADELKALIEDAKTIAANANDALAKSLGADIKTAAADVTAALTALIDVKVNGLVDMIEKNAEEDVNYAELDSKVNALIVMIDAAKDFAVAQDADLKVALEAAIKKASEEVTANLKKYVDDEVAKLQAAIDANAAADASLEELDAAIEIVKSYADVQDAALKTTLETAIADAIAALKTEIENTLNAKVSALEKADADNKAAAKADLDAEIKRVEGLITAAGEANAKALNDLKAELEADIAEVNDRVTAILEAWNAGTDAAVDAIVAVNKAYNKFVNKSAAVDALYEEIKIRIIRAVDATIVNDLRDRFVATVEKIDAVAARYDVFALKTAATDTYFDNAVAAIIAAKNDEDIKAICDKFIAALDAIDLVNAEYVAIDDVLYYVDELKAIETLYNAAVADILVGEKANADIQATFSAAWKTIKTKGLIIRDIFIALDAVKDGAADISKVVYNTTWGDALAKAKAMIDAEKDNASVQANADFVKTVEIYNALNNRYIVLEGYEAGKAIAKDMEALVQRVPVIYDNSAFVTLDKDTADMLARYNAWYADLATNAQIADELFIKDGVDLRVALGKIIDRIAALKAAAKDAADINADIAALRKAIPVSTVCTANSELFANIKAAIATWEKTYFTDAGYADEMVAENAANANYNLILWADWASAQTEFADAKAKFEQYAGKYIELVGKIPAEDNLFIIDELNDAIAAYLIATDNIGSYDYIFEEIFGMTSKEVYNDLMDRKSAYDRILANAYNEYVALKAAIDALSGTIGIYTTEYAEMLEWFTTYGVLGEDGKITFVNKNANGAADTVGYVLTDGVNSVTVLEADYNAYVAKQAEVKALEDAKKAETAELIAKIEAAIEKVVVGTTLVPAGKTAVDTESLIEAAELAYDAWEANIDFSNSKYNSADLATLKVKLKAARDKYDALEAEANAIHTDIAALETKTRENLFDDAARDAYEALVQGLLDRIAAFEAKNGVANVEFDNAKLKEAVLAVVAYDAIADLGYCDATYFADDEVKALVGKIVADATAVIDAARDYTTAATVAEFKAAAIADFKAAVDLAKAKYDAIKAVVDHCVAYGVADVDTLIATVVDDALTDIYAATTGFDAIVDLAKAKYDAIVEVVAYCVADGNADVDALIEYIVDEALEDIYAATTGFDAIVALAKAKYDAIGADEYKDALAAVIVNDIATNAVKTVFAAKVAAIKAATTVDAADDYNATATAKFNAIVKAYNLYVNALATIHADLKATATKAYASVIESILNDEVALDAQAIYTALDAASVAYVDAAAKNETLKGVYTDAKVYNVIKADIVAILAEIEANYDNAAAIDFGAEKFVHIVKAIVLFENAYGAAASVEKLESSVSVEFDRITDAKIDLTIWDAVITTITEAFGDL